MTPIEQRVAEIQRRMPTNADLRGVEVGIFQGTMSKALIIAMPRLTLWMVDSWLGNKQQPEPYRQIDDYHAKLSEQDQLTHMRTTWGKMASFGTRAIIMRQRSVDAAASFQDGLFDFVFIDADHSYEGCSSDIKAWMFTVKPGGWLCGHDYALETHPKFGVKRAVDEAAAKLNLNLELGANYTWFMKL